MVNLGPGNDNRNIDGAIDTFVDFGGSDTYTILPSLSGNVTVTDVQASTIQLPEGLDITAASFLADGVQFTINGFTVTFVGAPDASTFVFGGNPIDPNAGTPLSFADTAAAFGTTVPGLGEPPNAATQTGEINADGSVGDGGFFLPDDPGANSPDGIFFENVFFNTDTGDSNSTSQGLLALETTGDIFAATGTPSSFVVKNAELTVGDDLRIADETSVISFSGPSTVVTFPGSETGGNADLRVSAGNERSSTGAIYINDGAQVIVDHFDENSRASVKIAQNFGPEMEDDMLRPGGQSAVGTLVVEGDQTSLSVINSGGGERGSIEIARIDAGENGVVDTTTDRSANGLAIIRDGAEVSVRNFIGIGDAENVQGATADGTLIVEGVDTKLAVGLETNIGRAGAIDVGTQGGVGSLMIQDGAEVSLFAGDPFGGFLNLAASNNGDNGTATALVSGMGTTLLVQDGSIELGRGTGQAELTVSDGATVETDFVSVARGGTASITIEGAGTNVTLGGESGVGSDGFMRIAEEGGTGSLMLSDGASLHLLTGEEFRGGIDLSGSFDRAGGIANATVTGIGTELLVEEGSINVGRNTGEATLTISDGATVMAREILAARNSVGDILIEGVGTNVTLGGESGVGFDGFIRIGEEGGTGSLMLRDGAMLHLLTGEEFSGGIQLSGGSDRIGGTATATVTGNETELFVEDGNIDVGRNVGEATLIISDGATVMAREIFAAQNSIGNIMIEGDGTVVTLSDGQQGNLDIAVIREQDILTQDAPEAVGFVAINDGAVVNVRSAMIIGDANNVDGATADGALIVEGNGTTVVIGSEDETGDNGFIRIAEEGGTGSLILRDGAEIHLRPGEDSDGGIQLSGGSDRDGGTASAVITGEGTRFVAEKGFFEVGRNTGEATLTVSDGADVETRFFSSGREGTGATTFEGEGTTLILAGTQVTQQFGAFLTIGQGAEGSFLLRDGADVTITGDGGEFPGFQVGRNDGGVGTLTVTGAGSTITVDGADNVDVNGGETGFIRAGNEAGSSGTINVLDGGMITNDVDGILIVAANDGSTGIVTIDGAGSAFDFGADAFFSEDAPGARGNAIVTVSNGGVLEGDQITNNGILDVTNGGQLNADLIQDNILRSSTGIEDLMINGDLTVNTAGFGFDFLADGNGGLTHDTYTATGDVNLDGVLFVLATSIVDLDGLTADIITGSNITVSDNFTVQLVEFDANALVEVDSAALVAAAGNAVELGFTTTDTTLTVDFTGAGNANIAAQTIGINPSDGGTGIF